MNFQGHGMMVVLNPQHGDGVCCNQNPTIDTDEDIRLEQPSQPNEKPQLNVDKKEFDLSPTHGRNAFSPTNGFQQCGTRDIEPATKYLANPKPGDSIASFPCAGDDDKIIVSFHPDDPENPYNWSRGKKIVIVLTGIISVINSTLGSSLPSGAITHIATYFNVNSQEQLVLPISLYLVGYVLGPLFFAPLSETYGRRVIMLSSFILFTLSTLACALAPNWPAFLIFRLFAGINASSAISVVGGLFADVYSDPVTRGRAMAFFMAATVMGPLLAPIISGFVSNVSWRWAFWVGLIIAGFSLGFLFFAPETYGPTILKRRARHLRKTTGNPSIFAAIELEKRGARQMITVTLMRPLHMFIFEAIVLFTSLYLSLIYAIFYLFFEAYPLVFQGTYGMSTGISGLAFLPIGIGAFIACGIFIYYDGVLQRAKKANARWSSIEEYRRLPLACIGGPLFVISLFWLGWSAKPGVHWIVPLLAGLPFGIGFVLIFMSLLNYVTDAYEVFAASAMAATSCSRSIFGAVLPLAARPMYVKLGIAWASSLLGFLSLAMTIIPFAFIRYGDRIRANSKFCQELKGRKEQAARVKENEVAKGMLRPETKEDMLEEEAVMRTIVPTV